MGYPPTYSREQVQDVLSDLELSRPDLLERWEAAKQPSPERRERMSVLATVMTVHFMRTYDCSDSLAAARLWVAVAEILLEGEDLWID